MLSLGTTVSELEQKPFENGLGAARAALRYLRAQRSHARVLSQSAALPRAGADASPGNYGDVLSGSLSMDFTTVWDLWTPHAGRRSQNQAVVSKLVQPRANDIRRQRLRTSILAVALTAASLKHD